MRSNDKSVRSSKLVANNTFFISLIACASDDSGIVKTGTDACSMTSAVTLPIKSSSFWFLPRVPMTTNTGF